MCRDEQSICHSHNIPAGFGDGPRPYGIRVRLPPRDPMCRLLGDDWETYHWYRTERERDEALADMRREHLYSRPGDRPSIELEPVQRPAEEMPAARPNAPAIVNTNAYSRRT